MSSSRWSSTLVVILAVLCETDSALGADKIPDDLVVDVRVFEARSSSPDFKAMEELAFFINTDGGGVSEEQWLATIAGKATDSFLATLAFETIALESPSLVLELTKRSRTLKLSVDLSNFLSEDLFHADVHGELLRRDESQRSFEQTIEVRVGQTYVWSGRDLELSASEYLSHFRDYKDGDDRGELYSKLRNYTTFLIVALTPRLIGTSSSAEPVSLEIPDGAVVPALESPIDAELTGTVALELEIGADGTPAQVRIVRSSIPEVNSQILSAVEHWNFSEGRGKKGRLTLELRASP